MARLHRRAITLRVTFEDACHGVLRLANDGQRFGLTVRALTVRVRANEAVAKLSLLVPEAVDLDGLASRLSRHPTIRAIARIRLPSHHSRPATAASESLR